MATSKKPTAQQKEELVQTLKFTPRTYQVIISGYGGEIAMGKVDPKTVAYFRKHFIDVENYAYNYADDEDDDAYVAVPEELRPFSQGNWYECDNIEHNSGAEFAGSWITVYDENGETVLEKELGFDLEDDGCEIECFCEENIDEYVNDKTAVFVGQNFEKGTFFDAELELTEPFDISKFRFVYSEIAGWKILNCVEYNGEDLEGSDGYSTTGKSSSFSFYYQDANGETAEYNTPEYPAHQEGPSYWADDWEKVEFKFGKRNSPKIKGYYECVWKSWGTSYGKLFWDGENWIEYEYGKPTVVEGVESWSGLMWDTSDINNKPLKKPRKKKDAKPLTAKDVYPYPHELNGCWPEELSLPEIDDDWDPAEELDKIEVPVLEGEEEWAQKAIDSKPAAWPFPPAWTPADQTPKLNGVYEVKEGASWPFSAYAKFVDGIWFEQKNSEEDAEKSSKTTHHMHEWREVDQ